MPTILDFTSDPLAFMQQYPVWPVPGVDVARGGDFTVDDRGDDPTLRLALAPYGARGTGSQKLEAATTGQTLDVLYLKWASKRITKLTLNMGFRRFFFTSAINGCSVFVTGNAQAPTVYHAGIDGKLIDLSDHELAGVPAGCARAARAGDAPEFWRLLIQARVHGIAIAAEVNKSDYVNDGTLVNRPGLKNWFAWASVATTALAKEFGNTLWYRGVLGAEVIPWGSFWGMKDNNNDWSFYLQENAIVIKSDATQKGVVMRLRRVFPAHGVIFTNDGSDV